MWKAPAIQALKLGSRSGERMEGFDYPVHFALIGVAKEILLRGLHLTIQVQIANGKSDAEDLRHGMRTPDM
jgi:hypothetical protein